jgi:ABC-type branched-subunit amino acid transport system ATPase component
MVISRRDVLLGSAGALGGATFSFPKPAFAQWPGHDQRHAAPREAARAGVVHVIEGHRVFTQISVADNLLRRATTCRAASAPRGSRTRGPFFPEIAVRVC